MNDIARKSLLVALLLLPTSPVRAEPPTLDEILRAWNARAMPRIIYAHGWANLLAMDRPGDERGVISQRPNDRVLVEKRQR